MSVKNITNMAHSVRDRLLTLAKANGRDVNYLFQRYAYERFYYRLGKSEYSRRFILKGASLFSVWLGPMFRVTQDTDFESTLTPDHDGMRQVFAEIAGLDVPDDGVMFDAESLTVDDIKKEDKYKGVRVRMLAYIGQARINLQFDIGFGDSVYPAPVYQEYPVLLDGLHPRLKVYPQYTVLAEKLSAIVDLAMSNSRLKDYYDLWVLLGHFEFDLQLVRTAVTRTFARKELLLSADWPIGLTKQFGEDALKISQWNAFLRKIDPVERPGTLWSTILQIRKFFAPVLGVEALAETTWKPGVGWSEV